jgi:hypothetical protein
MTRDPWKRAYDRKRLESGGGDPRRDPPRQRWIGPAPIALSIALLALLGTGLYAAWHYRTQWLPRFRAELPPAVAEHVPVQRQHIDFGALELGVGHGLVLLGDYLDLISGTRELEPDWQVKQTGTGTLRLENDGILVYVKDGLIQTYTLDVDRFFAAEKWRPWHSEWRRAGISPDLTWIAYSGEEQQPGQTEDLYVSPDAVKLAEGWMHRAFNLEFQGGRLVRLEGRLEFGPGEDAAGG